MWKESFLQKSMVAQPESFPFMVIGNKLDLEDEGRAVSFNELEAFCEDHGAMGYMETSAKENMNVETCFMQLAAKALKR